ncbi:MAG: NapC/NirT family cytochrome c [Gammaproteobacteria bacterium]|nr:NapC/NirT family cytochrome c [Gammaproteobacteria bacterium]
MKPRISLAGFKDPVRRPRLIVLMGVWILVIAAVLTVVISATSSRWFCAGFCHQVQGDTIASYENSSHSEISCLACHMPVNADTVTFLLHKVDVGVAGVVGVVNGEKLPLNAESELAMNAKYMPERQCTQCHTKNRKLTPGPGIIIDHAVHAEKGVTCTQCHNRIAHNETGLKLAKGSHPHEDFMKMEGCYRCHALEGQPTPKDGLKAPGDCSACHPSGFELKPENHFGPGFYKKFGDSKGHATLAKADKKDTYCRMCHVKATFCEGCHGTAMPHPTGFLKTHGPAGKKTPAVCANCHAKGTATSLGTEFCNSCHHKQGDASKPWIPQHFVVVAESGATACFECHNPTFCAHCHVEGLSR